MGTVIDKIDKPLHHLAKPELQENILACLRRGMTQHAIAAMLHKSLGTIGFHVRKLREAGKWEIAAREYLEPGRVLSSGKRKCALCGRLKTPGAYPGAMNSTCTVCIRKKNRGVGSPDGSR